VEPSIILLSSVKNKTSHRRSTRQAPSKTPSLEEEQADNWEREALEKHAAATQSRGLPVEEGDLDATEKKAYSRLKAHRTMLSKEQSEKEGESVQTYKICHNRTLCEMVRLRPKSRAELEEV